MNSRANGRSLPTGRNQPERVFLVGVELLARPPARRDKHSGRRRPGKQTSTRLQLPEPGDCLQVRFRPALASRGTPRPLICTPIRKNHRDFSAEESMAELRELAISAGGSVIAEFLQRRQKPNPATLIGSGKLEELKGAVASSSP